MERQQLEHAAQQREHAAQLARLEALLLAGGNAPTPRTPAPGTPFAAAAVKTIPWADLREVQPPVVKGDGSFGVVVRSDGQPRPVPPAGCIGQTHRPQGAGAAGYAAGPVAAAPVPAPRRACHAEPLLGCRPAGTGGNARCSGGARGGGRGRGRLILYTHTPRAPAAAGAAATGGITQWRRRGSGRCSHELAARSTQGGAVGAGQGMCLRGGRTRACPLPTAARVQPLSRCCCCSGTPLS